MMPVYATGTQHDIHYYAMVLIDGPSLDRIIRQLRHAREAKFSGSPASDSENLLPTAMSGPYVNRFAISARLRSPVERLRK